MLSLVLAGTAAANGCASRVDPVTVEQAEVVGARAAPGDLEGVALHPATRVERLVVSDRGPRGDELARLVLHPLELRALVRRGVPRQHHPADLLVVLAVADHRDAAAARVGELGEEVDLLDALAEPLLVRRHLVERLGSETTTSRHFLVGIPTA